METQEKIDSLGLTTFSQGALLDFSGIARKNYKVELVIVSSDICDKEEKELTVTCQKNKCLKLFNHIYCQCYWKNRKTNFSIKSRNQCSDRPVRYSRHIKLVSWFGSMF